MTPEAIIALISTLIPIANNMADWISKASQTLKQDAELTPKQDAALDAEIAKLKINPEEWQKVQPLD